MTTLVYKKKYLKYKTKYNNLKLYGGNPTIEEEAQIELDQIKELCNIKELCKDNCINEEVDLINNCKNKIIDFEYKYIKSSNLLNEKKEEYQSQIEEAMNNLKFYKLNKACEINSENIMYSPTECQNLLNILDPPITRAVVSSASKTVGKVVGKAVDSADNLFSVITSLWGGGLTDEQRKTIKAIREKIEKLTKLYILNQLKVKLFQIYLIILVI